LEAATRALFDLGDQSSADFLRPAGEAALVSADSVSWRVFKNPLSLVIGGVAAVIMELAEPRVRTGIWEHTGRSTGPRRHNLPCRYCAARSGTMLFLWTHDSPEQGASVITPAA